MPSSDLPSDRQYISDEASRWIVRLNSGEATSADRSAVAAWRAADERHETAFREAEAAWAATSELRQDPTSGLVKPGARRKPSITPKKVSILLALGLTATLIGWSVQEGAHDYRTGTAEVREIVLPDGSRATLNARTALDLHFSATGRSITLDHGEVYLEVAPDTSRPFVVTSRAARVTALGTAFTVKQSPQTGDAEIVVSQHAVTVAATAQAPASSVRVAENQKVVIHGGVVGTVLPADPQAALSWRNGLLVAENKPLAEVVDALRQYHPGWIVMNGPALDNVRVSAVLNLREPAASLDTLAAGLPINVRHITSQLSVVTPR